MNSNPYDAMTAVCDLVGVDEPTARVLLRDGVRGMMAEPRRVSEGITPRRRARLLALATICHAYVSEATPTRPRIREPRDTVHLMGAQLRDLKHEEFHLILLDTRSRVLRTVLITKGLLDSSLVAPREVFRAAILDAAAGIILIHNHPSGDPTPSAEDRAVTRQLVNAGTLLDIPVYDHVIIAGDRYTSFATAGLL